MTPEQRAERARLAKQALDNFLAPAFTELDNAYTGRLAAVCASEPWATNKIAALANATRIVAEVRAQIEAVVADGDVARREIDHAKRIEQLSPAKKRLLSIGSH